MTFLKQHTEAIMGSLILLLLISTSVTGYQLYTIREEITDVPQQPPEVQEWNLKEDLLYSSIQDLRTAADDVENTFRDEQEETRSLFYAVRMKSDLSAGDTEMFMTLGHEAYTNARETFDEERQSDEKDRKGWEHYVKRMMSNILQLQPGQQEPVFSMLRKQNKKREEMLENFAEQFKKDENPEPHQLRAFEEQLNRTYENQIMQVQSQLTEKQINRYRNWLRSGSRRWRDERERLKSGDVLEMEMVGSRIQVKLHERDEENDRRR